MTLRSAILALLLCVAHAQARTLYVSLTGSHDTNTPAFSTWATAATNIQAAINAASGGDTIRIAHGTYTIDAAATNTEMCYVNKPLSIIGGRGTLFDADKTILNANGNRRVMSFGYASDPSVLRGVTLTGANTEYIAPGLYAEKGMTMDSCIVRGNYSSSAFGGDEGAIIFRYNYPGQIKNCLVVGNSGPGGGAGGGITSWTERKISVINSIVEANFPYSIRVHAGEILILNSICGNTSGVVTVSGGNIISNTTNSVMQLYDIAPASEGVGTNLVWAGVSAYIPRLGSLARKNGQPYAGIETVSDGAGGPALVMSRPFLGRDATTNLNHGAAIGGVSASTNSPFADGGSAAFDGVSGAVYMYPLIPNLANDFTVELWAYLDKQTPQYMFYQGDSVAVTPLVGIADPNNGAFQFVVRSENNTLVNLNAGTFQTTNWVHLALVWRAGEKSVRGYVNGVQVGGVTNANANDTTYSIASFGNFRRLENNWFGGNISDLRIWSVARTPEQIAAAYTNRLTGTEEGLVGYWPLIGTTSPIDTGPFNLDNPIIHPTYMEAF